MRPPIWCSVQQEKPNPAVTRFGVFELNRETGELRKQGLRLKLPAQAFHVLELLVEKPGELISRDELRQKLWPADTFVDFEHSLNATINRVREVLGDSAENSKFIETLPRRGYRFIAPVNRLSGSSPLAPFGRQRWIYVIAIIAAAVVVAIAGLGVYRRLSRSTYAT